MTASRKRLKALSILLTMAFMLTAVVGAPLIAEAEENQILSGAPTTTLRFFINQLQDGDKNNVDYVKVEYSTPSIPSNSINLPVTNTGNHAEANVDVPTSDVTATKVTVFWLSGGSSVVDFTTSASPARYNIHPEGSYTLPSTTGELTVYKVVSGEGAPTNSIFDFVITGPDEFSENFSITDDGSKSFPALEQGAYTVTELDWPDNFAPVLASQEITIVADGSKDLTFTNIYTKPQSNPHKGSLTITKSFDKKGDTPPEDSVFTFKIKDDIHGYSYEETITITGEDSYTIYNLKPGKYTVEETKLPQHFSVVGSKTQKVTVVKGEDREVTFVNKYSPPKAPLTITKVYDPESDESAPQDTVFTFKIKDNIPHYHFEKTVTITGEGSVDIWEIWPGDYTVEEILIPENFDLVGNNPQSVKVEKWKYKEVIFTNLYEEPYIPPTTGSLELTKVLPENFDGDSATFVFCITEPLLTLKSSQENAVASLCGYTLTIEYDGTPESLTEVLPELPEGYYLIEEIEMPDGFSPAEGNADGFFITIGETTKLNFANDYEEPETGIKIIKQLTGDTAPSNSTFEFTIKPAEQNGGPVDSYRVLLFSDQVESITYNGNADSLEKTIELPAGSYTVEETKWPDRFTPQDAGPKNVLVIEGEISNVIFINDYDAPPTITGGGGGGTSYYNLTINYLEVGTNDVLAPAYSTSMASASAYDVSDRTDDAIDGYVWDSISGDPTSGYIYSNLVINVYYTAEEILEEEEPPLGPIPEEEPQPIPEDEPDEIIVLEDETPLGDLPKTGTSPSPAAPAYLVPKEMELSFKEEDEE